VAELEENERCVKALDDADSACSAWAIDTIEIKLTSITDLYKKFEEEGYEEPPF
jgi:hypothetical protein